MIKGILAATILSSLMAGPVIAAVTGPVSTNSDALYPADQLMTGDDRWGCELLLCLANPNGWKSVSECHPPVEKYIDCSTKRHNPCSMPGCPQSGEGNYAQRNDGRYDPCMLLGEGYEEAPRGYLLQGVLSSSEFSRSGGRYYAKKRSKYNYDGEYESCDSDGHCTTVHSKACVKSADYQGVAYERYSCKNSDGYSRTCYRQVRVYSARSRLEPSTSTSKGSSTTACTTKPSSRRNSGELPQGRFGCISQIKASHPDPRFLISGCISSLQPLLMRTSP